MFNRNTEGVGIFHITMQIQRVLFIGFAAVLGIVLLSGCSHRPAGFPVLFPCRITVTNNGKPMPNVYVSFTAVNGQGSWGINGQTNSSGVATPTTSWATYSDTGVPAGNYTLSLEEVVILPDGKTIEDFKQMSYEEAIRYSNEEAKAMEKLRVIPRHLSDSNKSPLKFTVQESGKNEFVIEIGNYAADKYFEFPL
jgi:hypothetical protein